MERIGWKVGLINDLSLGLVKLEILTDDIISDPDIRKKILFTDKYMGCSFTMYEFDCIHDARLNYEDLFAFVREISTKFIKGHSHDWIKELDMSYLGPVNMQRIGTVLNYMKCRCAKAKVLELYDIDNPQKHPSSIRSIYDGEFVYHKGDIAKPTNVAPLDLELTIGESDPKMVICAPGIHYFEDWKGAILYGAVERESLMTIEYVHKLLLGGFNEVIFDG